MTTVTRVEAAAKKLNIQAVGITDAEEIDDRGELLRRKNTVGLSPFESDDLKLRTSVTAFRPGTRSVIAFGLNYYLRDRRKIRPGEGRLALISRGLDYHRVVKKYGQALISELNMEGSAEVFTDTHPLLERALAERAGLGYIGKHTQLIHPVYGSYLALGLILTDEVLPAADISVKDSCGDCRLCIDACPGKALSEYRLHPHRCLSAVTQMKGEIPEEFRKPLGNRLYGCDTCQSVCPKNRKVPETDIPELQPIYEFIDLKGLEDLSNREFRKKYGCLSGAWRGKKTWVRNGKIILENRKQNPENL